MENVFDVQDEIGRRVVESLQSRFSPAVRKSRDRYSSDPEAFDEFMAGLHESYSDRLETLESAVRHLSSGCRARPRLCAGACHAVLCLDEHPLQFDPLPAWLEKAEHHCQRALMLDPALPEGHLARSCILWSPAKNFQHAEAIEALEQVLAAQPNSSGPITGWPRFVCISDGFKKRASPTSRRSGRIRRPGAITSIFLSL